MLVTGVSAVALAMWPQGPCMCPAQEWGVLPRPVALGFCGVLTQP